MKTSPTEGKRRTEFSARGRAVVIKHFLFCIHGLSAQKRWVKDGGVIAASLLLRSDFEAPCHRP